MCVTVLHSLLASLALAAGCAAGSQPAAAAGGSGNPTSPAPAAHAITNLDQDYVIGPTAARELGRRIDFQVRAEPEGGSGVKLLSVQDDSVFVLDGRNYLNRLRREDGERLWRIPVADSHSEVYGITFLPRAERVFVTVGGDILALDETTGSQVARQPLVQMASTAPVVVGPFLVYGSRNGQLVWHSFGVGHQWRGYEISSTIRVPPVLADGYLVGVGADGRIMVLEAESAAGIWDRKLLDEVVVPPAAGDGLVYLSGLDQHVWAFELSTGRRAWRHLTEAPLTDPPTLIGDHLYQTVPTVGLVCFEARPVNAPGGVVLWTAPGVTGSVIGGHGKRLDVWDGTKKRLTVVEEARGTVVREIDLPQVAHLVTDSAKPGELYAASDDGRVIRLVPR